MNSSLNFAVYYKASETFRIQFWSIFGVTIVRQQGNHRPTNQQEDGAIEMQPQVSANTNVGQENRENDAFYGNEES